MNVQTNLTKIFASNLTQSFILNNEKGHEDLVLFLNI